MTHGTHDRRARRRLSRNAIGLAALALVGLAAPARTRAGSTEPALAIAEASPTVDGGIVTLAILADFDYGDVVRLGYPLAVVVTQGTTITRLYLDGTATSESAGGAPTPLTGVPGVVAIAPTRITAVLPSAATVAGGASVRLDATFQDKALHSNTVPVQW